MTMVHHVSLLGLSPNDDRSADPAQCPFRNPGYLERLLLEIESRLERSSH